MSSDTDTNLRDSQEQSPPVDVPKGHGTYRVVVERIRTEIETPDSFAIKFSLLTKTPLSKMKHLVGCLPVPIWTGAGRSRAESILKLVEEAGGEGKVIEMRADEPAPVAAKEREARQSCGWCGFPLKEGDKYCGFCMTPVGEAGDNDPRHPRTPKRACGIPAKRLLCYVVVLIVGIIITMLIR
ncbi:MAG: hypothetical protein PHD74_00030 [Candidatus Krumholzibacteria bacterium]|nr:hypothetical protein [Candidatus Krumholzibacteria bacterium]